MQKSSKILDEENDDDNEQSERNFLPHFFIKFPIHKDIINHQMKTLII
jgi:hypothetical protein